MKSANEVKSYINNIRYYAQEIEKSVKKQFEEDAKLEDMNTQVGSIRFDALGTIGAACGWIETYCSNIEYNTEIAVRQGKLLHTEEHEELF